ncbi:D-alanyl-D-alanine carboxypeptidase family protein [Anaeropeptidivorans aminofermentans]|uniref:D-alanyl-D-alanine carboxypeptidase family protein n=1 Tax=Anaeropeptidivorans aminofermentans TaxID=2934315 RepID=UPI0020241EA6|nr:D-alanyl-D-alanine carboxypeptidase family protein [Anaeropeptidivorans aminofermentans]MBE6012522.1 D-alanyl-D-alanine carboxypeptidase [Lachnospiraceae bacterium]
MKKIIFSFILAILLPLTAFAEEEIKVSAHGAILMDFETGRVLWEKNSKAPLAMASTTKIMTAIVALENGNLDDKVTVSKKAALAPEVKMHLSAGEEITLRDLLYALMLQSYNDSAVAIAEHISGDVASFCNQMTEKAKSLGAKDTVFETPNGLDAGDHHSTAYDLALITSYALKNEKFNEIINTSSYTAKSNLRSYDLYNKNRLLNEFQGANGVKTGFTGKAGHCFVGSAKRGDMQLISVVLASGWGTQGKEQKWIDTKRILSYGFEKYHYENIIKEGVISDKVNVTRSRKEDIGLYITEDFTIPITEEEKNAIHIDIDIPLTIEAPVAKDEVLGYANIYLGNELIKQIDIKTTESAERHDFETSIKKIITNWLNMAGSELTPEDV